MSIRERLTISALSACKEKFDAESGKVHKFLGKRQLFLSLFSKNKFDENSEMYINFPVLKREIKENSVLDPIFLPEKD